MVKKCWRHGIFSSKTRQFLILIDFSRFFLTFYSRDWSGKIGGMNLRKKTFNLEGNWVLIVFENKFHSSNWLFVFVSQHKTFQIEKYRLKSKLMWSGRKIWWLLAFFNHFQSSARTLPIFVTVVYDVIIFFMGFSPWPLLLQHVVPRFLESMSDEDFKKESGKQDGKTDPVTTVLRALKSLAKIVPEHSASINQDIETTRLSAIMKLLKVKTCLRSKMQLEVFFLPFPHIFPSVLINQSINQSIDRSNNQSINQSIDQTIKRSINQSIDRSNNQAIDQSINQSSDR